jgi:outer membrane immunogenic protein
VQAGYNLQAAAFVYGVEADFNSLSLKRSAAATGMFPFPFSAHQFWLTENSKTNWLATVRGRLGVTVVPSMLLYATGGVAFADFKFSSTYNDNAFPGGVGAGSTSGVKTGWTVGGGLEWMLGMNWTLKAEYLYVDLGFHSFAVPTANIPAPGLIFSQTMFVDADLRAHIARVGLNYKF